MKSVTIEPFMLYDKLGDNFNHAFAEYISGFSDADDFKFNDYMVLFMETMVNTTEESSQNPKYGEPVEFVFHL